MAELSKFQLQPGDPAPDFGLPGVDGRTYRLSDFPRQRLLAVVFWCNHCPYVQAWESRLIELAREVGPRGVDFVLINSNDDIAYPDDAFPKMVERARSKGYPFPYLRDETQEVAHAFGALVTPHPMLFGKDRRLLFQGRIDDRHDRPDLVEHSYLRSAIESALAGQPIERSQLPVVGCSVKWKA
jgi:peroxiredoxin